MKIQSRSVLSKRARYKAHRATTYDNWNRYQIGGLAVASAYIPEPGDAPDAVSWFAISLGMDDRRYVIEMNRAELQALQKEISEVLSKPEIRRVK